MSAANQQSCAVLTARLKQLAANHQEARGVIGPIFDLSHQHVQPIDFRRCLTGNGRRTFFVPRSASTFSVAGHWHPLYSWKMFLKPGATLGKRLGVRTDALNAIESVHAAH